MYILFARNVGKKNLVIPCGEERDHGITSHCGQTVVFFLYIPYTLPSREYSFSVNTQTGHLIPCLVFISKSTKGLQEMFISDLEFQLLTLVL